jgi:predicted nucleotide-binding protein (sugar kinase/HSP70/actin superfamily)
LLTFDNFLTINGWLSLYIWLGPFISIYLYKKIYKKSIKNIQKKDKFFNIYYIEGKRNIKSIRLQEIHFVTGLKEDG